MGIGELILVAISEENIYLSNKPQITFFKSVYKKYSNFALETIPQYSKSNPDFGKKQFEFPRKEISNRKSVRLSRHKDFTESCLVEFCKSHNIIL